MNTKELITKLNRIQNRAHKVQWEIQDLISEIEKTSPMPLDVASFKELLPHKKSRDDA